MDKVKEVRSIIVEGLQIAFYLHGVKIMELDCDNEMEVRRAAIAWMEGQPG